MDANAHARTRPVASSHDSYGLGPMNDGLATPVALEPASPFDSLSHPDPDASQDHSQSLSQSLSQRGESPLHRLSDAPSPDAVSRTSPIPLDKLETRDDDHSSAEHRLDLTSTFQNFTHTVKRKLYLHSRHGRNLTKEFTAGSANHHVRGKKERRRPPAPTAEKDVEAQLARTDSPPGPTFGENLWIMVSSFPYWNMAWWSGWSYSIGSAFFVIDGFWSWVPTKWPETEFPGESTYGVPLWFFFGAILYQVGGVMAYLEAVNDGSFAGAAMKRLLDGDQNVEKELLDAKMHTFFGHIVPHHHAHDDERTRSSTNARHASSVPHDHGWDTLVQAESNGNPYSSPEDQIVERRGGIDGGAQVPTGAINEYLTWRWAPTWSALWHYHIYEVGYLACTIQLFGVTLYGITAVVILPGILDNLEWWQELGAYWVPQIVASCCFLLASIMFTLMAQDKWYRPKPAAVSWWIGVWAFAGSVGFLLCAVFGLYSNNHAWAGFQSSISSTWGSFFYMVSGLCQWYEAININVGPVLAFPNNRTPVLLRKSLNRR